MVWQLLLKLGRQERPTFFQRKRSSSVLNVGWQLMLARGKGIKGTISDCLRTPGKFSVDRKGKKRIDKFPEYKHRDEDLQSRPLVSEKVIYKEDSSPSSNYHQQIKFAWQQYQRPAALIKNLLIRALDENISSALDNPSPIFNDMRYSGEILWIICRDVWSLKMPTTNIAQNTNPWDEAILDVIQVNRLPRLRKAALFIDGEPEDPEVVMHRLQVQNNAKNGWV